MTDLSDLDLKTFRKIVDGDETAVQGRAPDSLIGTGFERDRARVPWVFTNRNWIRNQGRRAITMWVNPSSIQLEMPKRATIEKNAGGMTVHEIKIRGRDTVYDEPTITFEASAGNIIPIEIRDILGETVDRIPQPGLVNMYDMMELLGESYQIESTGEPNFAMFWMSSYAFPSLGVVGFFDPQVFSVSHDAENPFSATYSLKFEVVSTNPRLDKSADLLRAFKTTMVGLPGSISGHPPIVSDVA